MNQWDGVANQIRLLPFLSNFLVKPVRVEHFGVVEELAVEAGSTPLCLEALVLEGGSVRGGEVRWTVC